MSSSNHGNNSRGNPGNLESNKPINSQKYIGRRSRKLTKDGREEESIVLDERVSLTSSTTSIISPSTAKKARKNISSSNTLNPGNSIDVIEDNCSLPSLTSESKTGHKLPSNSSKEHKDSKIGTGIDSRRRSSRLAKKAPFQNPSSASGINYSLLSISSSSSSSTTGNTDFIPATASVSSNTNKRNRKLSRGSREEETALDEKVTPVSGSSSLISPSSTKKARKNIALSTSTSSSCPPLSSVNTSKTSNNKDNTHLATTNTSRSSKNSRVSVVLGSGSSCTGSVKSTFNLEDTIAALQDNNSLTSVPSENKTGHKIGSNSSKERKDLDTGSYTSSRRRSSRLASKFPTQNASSASGVSYSSSIGSSLSSVAAGLSSCEASTSNTKHLSSQHSGSQDMEETNAGSTRKDITSSKFSEVSGLGANNTSSLMKSVTGRGSSTGAGVGMNNVVGSGSSSATSNVSAGGGSSSGLPLSSSMSRTGGGLDSESDDNEMGRLQALLEARGLPPHLFSALGPRVHHILHRSMGNKASSKAHQLIQGLQAQGDEGQQLQAVMEMCQLLVMGNEDTLAGFPAKQAVPALIALLQLEQNFDIMNHSCRALTYMMESLPRSSAIVVDAIPAFLEKLQFIQCMDVAEQSLTALEMLSRRHSKAILHAGGVPACLSYLDFFTINAQRAALSITANCCQNLSKDEFSFVKESLSTLSSHLIKYQDKKCLESLCLAFSRLVDSFQHHSDILEQITGDNLLANVQQLLLVSPPIISTGTFVMVIRMLATMCVSCPKLAVQLLKLNISDTIRYLLLGPSATSEYIELATRSPQELYEITSLIGELMPKLPNDGIFSVDMLWTKQVHVINNGVTWQWKDDRGMWHNYSALDSKMMEAAHQANEDEISLSTMGRTYIIDFNSMQQINEDTGTSRSIQRLVNSNASSSTSPLSSCATTLGGGGGGGSTAESAGLSSISGLSSVNEDARIKCLKEEPELAETFVKSLFGVLYEVYSSSAGPSVRHKCIRALLRIIYYSSSDILRVVLKNHAVSSHIAAMLPSPDLRVVVGAIQMVYILMEKLPDIFSIYFRREGVIHQLKRIIQSESSESIGCGGRGVASLSSSPSTSSPLNAMATSPNKLSTNIKLEPQAGPSTPTSGSVYGQNYSSQCYLESSSSLSNLPSLQPHSSSCDVPPVLFTSSAASERYHAANMSNTANTNHSLSMQVWDNSSAIPDSSPCASAQSLASFTASHHHLSSQVAAVAAAAAAAAATAAAISSSTRCSDSVEARSSQSKLNDVLKRKRSSKKGNTNSLSGSTQSSSSSALANRKSRNDMESSLSVHYKNCISSPPATSLSSTNRVDYDSVSASLNPQLLSSPYISMPFFAYSANTRSPSMNNASTATSFSSNTNNMISTSNSLIGINNNNNSNNVNSSNICIAGGSNSSSHTGLNALGPSSTISMPISSATSNPILVSGGPVTGRGRSSKFSSAAAKTSSFFANLYPARWRRWSNANPTIIGSNGSGNLSGNRKSMLISQSQDQLGHVSGSSSSASPRSPHNNGNKEKVRQWIKEQAKIFVEKYFDNDNESNEAMSTLNRINGAMEIFEQGNDLEALKEFKSVLLQGDISPFELIHCGMINKLINHLTHIGEGREEERDARIRRFLHVFIGTPADDLTVINNETDLKLETGPLTSLVVKLNACISQLEQFPVRVHDVIGTGTGNIRGTSALKFFNTHQLKCNLQRHRDCTNLKQWRGGPVKIDPLALVQAIERYLLLRGYGRVKEDDDENSDDDNSDEDFDDNMAKVVMNQGQGRHKLQFLIDDHILPFNMTVYQAIRQFSSGANSQSNDGHETDTDFDAPMGHTNMWVQTHTIYYRQYVEPESLSSSGGSGLGAGSPSYCVASGSGVSASSPSSSSCPNMSTMNVCSSSTSPSSSSSASASVQMSNHNCSGLAANNGHSYSSTPSSGGSGSSSNSGPGIGSGSSGPGAGNSGRRSSKSSCSKNSAPKKKDELWLEGKAPMVSSTVYNNLSAKLPSCVTICDASLEVMNLLRIVNALNRSWGWFYHLTLCQNPAIPQSEFVNSKLTAKANRQLQDPLVIMTGNLPQWLSQIAYVCPFLFPFETRHLLFYITSFDRDRALQRLLDTTPGLNSNDSSERVTPRLDKRKKTVTREDILRQAESVFHDVGNSKALLEIQYENEVGTGLGPTLEFYALVSKELQRADLDMWRGEAITSSSVIMPISYSNDKGSSGSSHSEDIQIIQLLKNNDGIKEKLHQQYHHHHISQQQLHQAIQYIYSTEGLFPQPISKSTKTTALSKIKSRYKLLGKFMAKALCDSRMVDLPLSIPFYKWLLGQELTLNVTDLHFIDATLAKSVINMDLIAQRKKLLERGISGHTRETLTMSGVAIEDLALDFTLPGFPNIELRKGGKDMSVTLDNIDQYLRLMIHWTMVEGVSRQMEAFKEGFESVLPLSQLQIFYPEELEQLFCGSSHQTWDIKTLIDCCHPDHGYTYDSRAIKFLFEVLSTYNAEEQRKFLQFVTGSPRLPVGGLKSLSPPLTVVRKTFEPGENPDNYLPSVMTCVNYLKLPDYSSIEVMREKLMLAANEGQHSFHLS